MNNTFASNLTGIKIDTLHLTWKVIGYFIIPGTSYPGSLDYLLALHNTVAQVKTASYTG